MVQFTGRNGQLMICVIVTITLIPSVVVGKGRVGILLSVRGSFSRHLAGVCLSKFGLHLLYTESSQSFIRCRTLQALQGPILLF